ncbi:pteridine transporter, putative [Trypanosoma brucei gambiense DAL972]|uniref:Pteridine transporter, putative n=1 Tax=Trypanosoma brucei gambiense (strain MHOM/CI/86/DAL972) TaxID=679716 RepID=C9ZIK0_TRYB9|nr:pteridine transporter, putative [Trypanosoma brucei gambiense DAL972]CBH08992.1 pteridine transporter, putative [Trypanosoma brucei gambiense DAL972]|eukprot:XP_011771433.1 pteridine transporter, putative [Trypanosoma brucei gambiense DAL972]
MGRQEDGSFDARGGDAVLVAELHSEESKEATFVHPEARALFNKVPCLRHIPLFGEAAEGYGPKPVLSIGLSYFLCKGLANGLVGGSIIAMFLNRFTVEGLVYQRLTNIAGMGWSVKPLLAAISDIFPFFGYTKRWYMFVANLVGPAFSLGFALLPAQPSSAAIASVFLFFSGLSRACTDILSQGLYSRMMRRVPGPGPALVSWVWWFIILAGLFVSVIVGPLGDAGIPQISPMIGSAVQLLVAPFFLFNWFGELPNREERYIDAHVLHEQKLKEAKDTPPVADDNDPIDVNGGMVERQVTNSEPVTGPNADGGEAAVKPFVFREPRECCCGVFQMNEEVLERNKRETIYSVLIAFFVVGVAITSLFGSRLHLLIAAAVVSVGHCSFNFYALSWAVAKVNLFSYLHNASTVSFGGAVTPFFLSGPDCNPGGPHFNLFFLQTVGGTVGSVTSALGVVLFNYFLSKKTYRMTYFLTLVFLIVSNIFDFIIVMRWNRPYVSDYLIYFCCDVVISPVIGMMHWMPLTIILSRLCPRGSESTVYAILAASSNFGGTVGSSLGSVIMEYALPVKTLVPCDFANVKWLVLISGFVAPCIQIPLIFTLLPDARMDEELDGDGKPVRKVAADVSPEGKETVCEGDSDVTPNAEGNGIAPKRS